MRVYVRELDFRELELRELGEVRQLEPEPGVGFRVYGFGYRVEC